MRQFTEEKGFVSQRLGVVNGNGNAVYCVTNRALNTKIVHERNNNKTFIQTYIVSFTCKVSHQIIVPLIFVSKICAPVLHSFTAQGFLTRTITADR
jgi:hypothetical protein